MTDRPDLTGQVVSHIPFRLDQWAGLLLAFVHFSVVDPNTMIWIRIHGYFLREQKSNKKYFFKLKENKVALMNFFYQKYIFLTLRK